MTATPHRLALSSFSVLSSSGLCLLAGIWNRAAKSLRYREQHLPKNPAEQVSAAAAC